MTVRSEFVHDLCHPGLEDNHAGIKRNHAGIKGPHHVSERPKRKCRGFSLSLNRVPDVAESALNRSKGRFDGSQAVAPVVVHQDQGTASAYLLRRRIVFELEP